MKNLFTHAIAAAMLLTFSSCKLDFAGNNQPNWIPEGSSPGRFTFVIKAENGDPVFGWVTVKPVGEPLSDEVRWSFYKTDYRGLAENVEVEITTTTSWWNVNPLGVRPKPHYNGKDVHLVIDVDSRYLQHTVISVPTGDDVLAVLNGKAARTLLAPHLKEISNWQQLPDYIETEPQLASR